MNLATKRLRLRSFTPEDIDAVYHYSSKQSVTKFMAWGPNTYKDAANFVYDVINKGKDKPRHYYDFVVTLKDNTIIGACGVYFKDLESPPSLGWVFDDTYWQNGYASEVAAALLSFAFKRLKVKSLYAVADEENVGSYKVMEKVGMRFVKKYSKEYQKTGKRIELYYELTALEYNLLNHKIFI